MSEAEQRWLDEVFPTHQGKMVRGEVLQAYYEAERILKGKQTIQKRGCSCQFTGMAREVDRLYEQYRNNQKG